MANIPNFSSIERLPWPVRVLLGGLIAAVSVGLTYAITPLRAFPLLLAFPTVVLSSWFLGIGGGIACAMVDALLVDAFLTKSQFRFSIGFAPEATRLTVFLVISTFVGWAIGWLAEQRVSLRSRELEQRLALADVERQLAEERAAASEALRDRDEALELALRANRMGLRVWDLQHGTVHGSDELYRLLGVDPASIDLATDEWLRCIHPEDADGVKAALEQVRNGGKDYHRQYRVVWPDGSVRWLEAQGSAQRESSGQTKRVVEVLTDVTLRKQADEAMLRAEKLAVAGRLAAAVAHEINNPLEAVTNLLYLITLSPSVDDARSRAEKALDELMRISLVTQSTLKFHRQSGTPKATQLSEMIESVTALFRGKLLTMEIAVDVRVKDEVPVTCMPSETQQIFVNLVANAIEAMQQNGRLTIRLRPSHDWRDRARQGMRVTICDSGPGMNRATMRRIFEPFFTTKTDTGTGLGMWVVMQLLERHHGHLRLWSRQRAGASGTAFSVFIPAKGGSQESIVFPKMP